MSEYIVEHGIPIPDKTAKYPVEMAIGDSFIANRNLRGGIIQCFRKKGKQVKTMSLEGNMQIRVWRIK